MELTEIYYKKILHLFIEEYKNELIEAQAGHCMKVTGLALDKLEILIELIRDIDSLVETYILSDTLVGDNYISATKLIELRNDLSVPILILVPINSRTSAEDSYGNATFKVLSVEHLDSKLYELLHEQIQSEIKPIVDDVFDYLKKSISKNEKINYLLYLSLCNYEIESIGHGLYILGLIPDSILASKKDWVRKRLSFNIDSIKIIADFSKTISDRISSLPIGKNTIQKDIASFLQIGVVTKRQQDLCKLIYSSYPKLDFSNWEIPEMEIRSNLLVRVGSISGKHMVVNEDGDRVLTIKSNKKEKIKIKIYTDPKPKNFKELKFFRIAIMGVDGMYHICDIKKAKVTDNDRNYRDITLELSDSLFEEGSYYFHVFAEDEYGSILNSEDPFKEDPIQAEWERISQENADITKEQFQQDNRVLLTSDTETFYLKISDEDEDIAENETSKAKIDNVLQAYFHYRIDQNRKGEELNIPTSKEDSNKWLAASQLVDIFHVKYDSSHNYQIALSRKLLQIERCFLEHDNQMGQIHAAISANHTDNSLQSLRYIQLSDSVEVPDDLLNKRRELFKMIRASAPDNSGVTSTFEFYNSIQLLKEYITEYSSWLNSLTKDELNIQLSIELQNLDLASLDVEMPDGTHIVMKLLSPLHPLRLAWIVNLFELYEDWEEKTEEYPEYRKAWSKKLDQLFYGGLIPDVAPLILVDKSVSGYYQYVGELTFGWGIYANPAQAQDDAFASSFRQLKSYLASLLNIATEKRIDSDVNQSLVFRHFKNYIKQHPYTDKLIINLFNVGDAMVFAKTLIELEREWPNLKYEVRLFCDDVSILPGDSLRDLLNPETQISEEAEAFSQASENRLFPKLRFSINKAIDFINAPSKYQAHISFLVNPFQTKTVLTRQEDNKQSFYLNAVMNHSIVQVVEKEKGYLWNRYFSENTLPTPVSEFANSMIGLFSTIQSLIANTLSVTREQSVPSIRLDLNESDIVMLSLIHDVSDWVVTFDKNMGPEFYDLPSVKGEIPYLLDYIPSRDVSGISSYLTTKPTSEIEGLMAPHFKNFDIDILNKETFNLLLEDIRSVSSSLIMQFNSSRNKVFEVLGTTFMKRMLEKKGLLQDAFLIPIDLHKELFEDLESQNKERADNLLVDIHPSKREIVFTVIEIKCRKNLSDADKVDLQDKMHSQIENTILAIRSHFDTTYQSRDRLDRELKTIELQSLLTFYLQRANRYGKLNSESFEMYTKFLSTLLRNEYIIRFKNLGIIFDFSASVAQKKEFLSETTFYLMGEPVIGLILDKDSSLKTTDLEDVEINEDFTHFFEVSDRSVEVLSFKTSSRDNVEITTDIEKEQNTVIENKHLQNIIPLKKDTEQTKSTVIAPNEENVEKTVTSDANYEEPECDIMIGKTSGSKQYGILGKTFTGERSIAIDLSETNTISLFGVQGGGKSYTIGTITEMVLKQFSNVNKLPAPLAGVIFHYSKSMDYVPEFTSMIYPNDDEAQLKKLKDVYGANADSIADVVLLVPKDKLKERQAEYPSIKVHPINFHSSEINVQDWMFLLGAVGNDSTYIKQLKSIMKSVRSDISLKTIRRGLAVSPLLSTTQKALAEQKLQFAEEYIDDDSTLKELLRPGRLIVVDLRDEFIEEDEALGLFVVMLNIFSSVKAYEGKSFNKFIVFDEAHKYMNNNELTGSIVTAIREMRHKGVSLMIASQDPMSLPTDIIELSSIMLLHKFNSPQWVKHVQKSITQLATLTSTEMASLFPGEAYLWATKSTDKGIMNRPIKISTRPRVTKHGGDTIKAI